MAIDYITPETFNPGYYSPQSFSYDPRQYMPAHCIEALLSLYRVQKMPRKTARLLIGQFRAIADGLDHKRPETYLPERPHDMGIYGPAAEAAEMNRLRHLADYLDSRITEFPDV